MKNLLFTIQLFNGMLLMSQEYDAGIKDYESDQYQSGINHFSKAIQNGEKAAKSYRMRAACYIGLSQYSMAIADLESSLKIDSTAYLTYTLLGRAYGYSGLYSKAVDYFTKSIALNKDYVSNYEERALSRKEVEVGDLTGAIEDMNHALELDSGNAEYYAIRGSIYYSLKEYNKALADLNESIKRAPNATNYGARAEIIAVLGNHEKAISDYSLSLALDPNNKYVLYLRGLSYSVLNKVNEACADYKKSADLGHFDAKMKSLKCK